MLWTAAVPPRFNGIRWSRFIRPALEAFRGRLQYVQRNGWHRRWDSTSSMLGNSMAKPNLAALALLDERHCLAIFLKSSSITQN